MQYITLVTKKYTLEENSGMQLLKAYQSDKS